MIFCRSCAQAKPEAKLAFDALTRRAVLGAQRLTDRLTNGSMPRAFIGFVLTVVLCGAWAFSTGGYAGATRPPLPMQAVPLIGWTLLMIAAAGVVLCHHDRLLSLVLVGVIGLIVSGFFLYLSAPDLALTQISVEVVTVILMLLALNGLPRRSPLETPPARRGMDACVAALAGLAFGGLAWAVMRGGFAFPPISEYMLANSYALGGGDNVVNVILVDFRGYDTFGEITVLGIAGLVIVALARLLPQTRHAAPPALMLAAVTRMLMPLALVVAAYIFLRGHNQPGGGFVAGLVVAIALVAQVMASGHDWFQDRNRLSWPRLIGAGVMVAAATGMAAWLAGVPFLTSAHGYLRPPGIEPIALASAMGFDLGVFLCVLGAVMLSLESLTRVGAR